MKSLLGDEYESFEASFEKRPFHAIRLNTLKTDTQLTASLPWSLEPVGGYETAGFRISSTEKVGAHPAHAAGLLYVQEPSAMTVGQFVAPQPGELVLDLAAAPGGKSTHLAALMQGEGLLVSNDVHRQRAFILAQNLERWGVQNGLITASSPEKLAQTWGAIFDRVLVDAPCSGEGMFRKQRPFEWSGSIVAACARRQTAVLQSAVQLVKSGGRLVYSTCTFSPEENEAVIDEFLETQPDFSIVEVPKVVGMAEGQPSWIGSNRDDLSKTVRLWPHRFQGEGHFVAVMARSERASGGEKRGEGRGARGEGRGARGEGRGARGEGRDVGVAVSAWRGFESEVLRGVVDEGRLMVFNGRLFQLPSRTIEMAGVSIIRHGVELGEVRKGHFRPGHGLAMILNKADVQQAVDFEFDDPAVRAYLRGEMLESEGQNGWVLITVNGYGLGWGKRVNGRVKNHYPKGLRNV